MALETIKIAELPSATQIVEDDYLVVEQPDKTKKATIAQVISDLDKRLSVLEDSLSGN